MAAPPPHPIEGGGGPPFPTTQPAAQGSSPSPAAASADPPHPTLRFRVAYPTTWGQCVAVSGAAPLLGAWDPARALRMACRHEPTGAATSRLVWEAAVALPPSARVDYKYVVLGEDGGVVEAEPEPRTVPLPPPAASAGGGAAAFAQVVILADAWAGGAPPPSLLGRAAFTRAILRPEQQAAAAAASGGGSGAPPPAPPSPPPPPRAPGVGGGGAGVRAPVPPGAVLLRLAVRAWGLAPGEGVVAAGSAPALGSWRLGSALRLARTGGGPRWEAEVAVPAAHFPLTFRFAIAPAPGVEGGGGGGGGGEPAEPRLEAGENRVAALDAWSAAEPAGAAAAAAAGGGGGAPLSPPPPPPPALLSVDGGHLRPDRPWRGGGLAIPLFSVRSAQGLGTGEFADIPALAAWAASAGLSLLQLLPINDTGVTGTWEDSYPYAALSVFALHPLYVDVEGLGPVAAGGEAWSERAPALPRRLPGPATAPLPPALAARAAAARARLNALPDLDYEAVVSEKLAIARAVYEATGLGEVAGDAGFKAFAEENAAWLRPYAAHDVLRALFGSPDHWTWGSLARPTPADLDRLCAPTAEHAATVRFHWWLQWKAHAQLAAAADAAAALRVALKGDLPIGVDRRGVDAWAHPSLFRMAASTGAPPDYFDPRGQAWGFPTYDWEASAGEGFAWWRARLAHLARYFSALRIDHILGFFRIWELPARSTTGLLGRFRPGAAISRADLDRAGIWDVDRLADPHITPGSAAAALSAAGPGGVARFTRPGPCEGRLALRPEVWDEEDIEGVGGGAAAADAGASAASLDGGASARSTAAAAAAAAEAATTTPAQEAAAARAGLLSLRHNVLLIRDGDAPDSLFHPRIGLAGTPSFAALKEANPGWAGWLENAHDSYFHSTAQDAAWAGHARSVLPPLLAATDMLICGEDLGMVPACVDGVLGGMGVLGLRVQRMPSEPGVEFGDPAAYPYLSVASPSTHDTPPLRAWWEGDGGRRERFWAGLLGGKGDAPALCTPAVADAVVRAHAASPAMLAIFAIQDLLALSPFGAARPAAEEVVNDPTVRKHYWRYRCQVGVEELRADVSLTDAVRNLMVEGGRSVPPVPAGEAVSEGEWGGGGSHYQQPPQASLEDDLAVLTLGAAC